MIHVKCMKCNNVDEVADVLAGMAVICKACGRRNTVPHSTPVNAAITSTPLHIHEPMANAIQDSGSEPARNLPTSLKSLPSVSILKDQGETFHWPEWATSYVKASLRVGLKTPEIEKRLVERGMERASADALISSVLEEWLASGNAGIVGEGKWGVRLHRGLSALVVAFCFVLAYRLGGGAAVGRIALWVMMPLACIWVPDWMDRSAVAIILRWFGWLPLLAIAGFVIWVWASG